VVNRASRLVEVAAPATLAVDDEVERRVHGADTLIRRDLGELQLEGLGPTRVWRIGPEGAR